MFMLGHHISDLLVVAGAAAAVAVVCCPGFRHPGNAQKTWIYPVEKTSKKTRTKRNSISVCYASNN